VGTLAARISLDRLDADDQMLRPSASARQPAKPVSSGLSWVTLLDNHDLPRLASSCSAQSAQLALALLFSLRGIPSLTYGTEAGLQGATDPANRGDLEFPVQNPLRAKIAELAALRLAHPALASGRTLLASSSRDAVAELRWAPGEAIWIAVARGRAPAEPPAGGAWRPLLETSAEGVTLKLSVAVDAAAVAALAQELDRGGRRPVHFEPVGTPALQPGDAVAVVGSAPELGAWDPRRAVPAAQPIELPANNAYELKLVVRRAKGSIEWQPGANDIVYIAAGDAPQTVTLRWNPS
jgi:hypothetical protein